MLKGERRSDSEALFRYGVGKHVGETSSELFIAKRFKKYQVFFKISPKMIREQGWNEVHQLPHLTRCPAAFCCRDHLSE